MLARLSRSYAHDRQGVIICAAITEGEHPYQADNLAERIHAAHTYDPTADGVDCRVPAGVQSLGFANAAGDRYTSIKMGPGSIVNFKHRYSQIALPPDAAGDVAVRVAGLIFYEEKSTDLYTGTKFTRAELASHPNRSTHAAANKAKRMLAQGGSGPQVGEKRPRESDHLPPNFRSTKPNTDLAQKLSNSKNPDMSAQEATRHHWAPGTKGTDSTHYIELSDYDDDDDDDAEGWSSVQPETRTQAPMGASQSTEVRRPVLLACNAPATLSARAVSMRSSVCAGDRAARAGVPVAACVDDHRGAR